MVIENRFNLIDEPWIPIADLGRVSLRQLFNESSYRALGGNPVQKIALMKLLLAIAQAAATPKDDDDWRDLGAKGVAKKCLDYVEKWHDRFWLYGENPFLQIPGIYAAAIQPYGAVLPDVSTGNTTVLTQSQVEKKLSNADKALLLIVLMGFALGGKKADNSVVLTPNYMGKTKDGGKGKTGSPGPSVGHMGFSHHFLLAETLQESIWLNLFTHQKINDLTIYSEGIGTAPWENMPQGEACDVAKKLTKSLMGRLISLSRFCLLTEEGLHYSEGLAHLGYKDGMVDPSMAVNTSGKEPKAHWIDPEKRPWRELTALLSFVSSTDQKGFECFNIRYGLLRARMAMEQVGLWSGGLRVSSNAGEQYVSGSDDFVESTIVLNLNALGDSTWFETLKNELSELDITLSKIVYGCTMAYAKEQKMDGDKKSSLATQMFWQLCEREFQHLITACDEGNHKKMRRVFAGFAQTAYDRNCPKETARQLDAWAKNKPSFSKYLSVA